MRPKRGFYRLPFSATLISTVGCDEGDFYSVDEGPIQIYELGVDETSTGLAMVEIWLPNGHVETWPRVATILEYGPSRFRCNVKLNRRDAVPCSFDGPLEGNVETCPNCGRPTGDDGVPY